MELASWTHLSITPRYLAACYCTMLEDGFSVHRLHYAVCIRETTGCSYLCKIWSILELWCLPCYWRRWAVSNLQQEHYSMKAMKARQAFLLVPFNILAGNLRPKNTAAACSHAQYLSCPYYYSWSRYTSKLQIITSVLCQTMLSSCKPQNNAV